MSISNYGSLKVVNTSTVGNQYQAVAAGLATGQILVIWYDDNLQTIHGQYYDALGTRLAARLALP